MGFFIFFVLILASFITTNAIITKSLFRYQFINDKTGAYTEDFYRNNGAYHENEKILKESLKVFQKYGQP